MEKLLLIVMFVSSSAAAREFSFDADALGKILAETRALKSSGLGFPPPVIKYQGDQPV